MLRVTSDGLYCEVGHFFVDPWSPVDRALITHAHADHAHPGCQSYLCAAEGRGVLLSRVGFGASIETAQWGEPVWLHGVRVSFHPAGHILGSAQIRMEYKGDVWVVSGDYKLEADGTCRAFEPVRCHTFITESTFGLPIYRWRPQAEVLGEINAWWRANQQTGKASVLFAYALGKAQRVLAGVDAGIGPIWCHGAVELMNQVYRGGDVDLPETRLVREAAKDYDWSRALILAPPLAHSGAYLRKFGAISTGFASGWMRIRGPRRRRSIDRGFVLSDHADWPGLLSAIEAAGARRVLATHGYGAPLVRWLREKGQEADVLETRFEGERDDGPEEAAE